MDRVDILALGRAPTPRPSQPHRLLVAVIAAVAAAGAHANPTGGDVTTGSANISQSGSAVTIDQTSSRVAINWQTFNIGTGESVTFNQPSAQALALNRILGQAPSLIQGTLTANGQIFLLNPNGVLFGAGAQVNVGGIVASTLGLSKEDFLAGRYTFTSAGNSGSVLNEGTIQAADGGYVAFAGSNVTNAGVIRAHLGTVALGAGDQVTMNIDGGRLVGFNVDKSAIAALASNRQLIEAGGGTVILSARAKDALLATVVNSDGVIEARSVNAHNGVIELDGGADGVVAVSGTLDASGVGNGETGGRVDVTGDKVALLDGAVVDVSGSAGGGAVRIGGDYHGDNPDVPNASRTFVASSATIAADALDTGDGGRVVVWADDDTQFHGSISARGGESGGDGGFVEVSGKEQLGFDGSVDTSALRGAIGTLLLDPDDLFIAAAAVGGALPDTTNPFTAADGTNNFYVLGSTLTALAPNTAVQLQANHDIIFQTNLAMPTTAAGSLTMNANNAIQMAGFNLSTSGANVSMTAGTGGISNLGTINLGSGALTLSSVGAITQNAGDVIAGATRLVKQGTGTLTLSNANTYAGTTTVSSGTLAVTVNNALGTSAGNTTVASGATLDLRNVAYGTTEAVTLNGGTLAASTGTSSLGGGVTLGGNSAVNVTGTQLTLSRAIGGPTFGIDKQGSGTLVLSGANTYTGTTAVSGGTLRLGAANRIANTSAVTVASGATFNLDSFAETVGSLAGAGTVTLGSATLTSGGDGTSTTFSGVASGTGGLTKTGAGVLTLSGANTYTGVTRINAGIVRASGGAAIADASQVTLANVATAFLDLTDDEGIGNLSGGGTAGGNVTLNGNTLTVNEAAATTFSGVLRGSGGFTKEGAAVLTLSGVNTYTGATAVNVGTLRLGAANRIADASALTVAGGATFNLNNQAETVGSIAGGGNITLGSATLASGGDGTSTTFSGIASGTGRLTKTGSGVLTLSGGNTYTGATTINGGTVRASGGAAIADTSQVTLGNVAGASFDLTGSERIGNLSGGGPLGGNVTLNGNTLTVNQAGTTTFAGVAGGTGGLIKQGTGALTLTGANTYSGDTAVTAGTLTLGASNVLADATHVVVNGGTLAKSTNSDTVAGVQLVAGSITGTTGTLTSTTDYDLQSGTVSSILGGAVGANKSTGGTVILSRANTYTGATNVGAGTLAVTANNALGATAAGTTVAAGATLDLRNVTYGMTEALTLGGGTLATSTGTSSFAGAVTLGANSAVNVAGTQLTLSGAIGGGAFGIDKLGAGRLVLSGLETYTGTTAVSGGTLRLGAANRIADASAVTVAAGATFDLNNFAQTVGSLAGAGNVTLGSATLTSSGDGTSTTFSGIASGTGGLTKTGGGVFTLSGANGYSGATAISAGTLVAANASALGATTGATTVANNATLRIANVAVGTEAVTLNGAGVAGNGALVGTGAASLGGAVTVASNSTIAASAVGDTLSLAGTVNGPVALTQTGAGTVAFGGAVGGTTALASFTSNAGSTTQVNGGSIRTAGTQLYNGALTTGGATTLQTTNAAITANGAVTTTAGTLTLVAGTGNATFTNTANDFGTVGVTNAGAVNLVDVDGLNLAASSVSSLRAQTLAGDITISGIINATGAGDSIVLAAGGNFVNAIGSTALNPGAGRWLVWSTNPLLDTRGGLANVFKQYNATYGVTPVAGVGNGFLYTLAPTISVALTGTLSKVYDGSTGAALAPSNYNLSGAIDGDTVAINNPAGTYDNRNVGTNKNVAVSGLAITGATNLGTTVYGYQLASTSANANIGTITPAALTVTATTNSKTYDGTTSAGAAPIATGLVGGDTATGLTEAYADNNAGTGKTLLVSGYTVDDGNGGNNYTVSLVNNTTGVINQAALTGNITAANKTYDATDAATIDSRTLSGVIVGDTVSYVGGTATFSDKNAALGKLVTATGLGLAGADAGNYTVNTTATTTADIATLAITGAITAANKTYDGTDAATIDSRALSGVIGGDAVSYVGGTATFADKNAALGKTVTATGLGLAGADAGNYSVNAMATTTADIATLAITGAITAANKTYDGTTDATIVGRTLAGVIAGDTVSYVGGTATFADKNAALGKTVAASGLGLAGLDAGNYTVNTTASTTADITALAITGAITAANKTYDGTTAATITDRSLSGVIAGDTVDYVGGTATFADKNAGSSKTVTATGLGLGGADANNYSVNTTATTTADIAALTITGAITAANKTYDGTTAATITDRTLTGVISGDTVSYVGGTANFSDKNAGLGKTVTATGLGLAGLDAGNYTVNTTATTTADIATLAITGAVTAANKTYDGTTAATITDRTLTGVISGDAVSYVGGIATFADKNAALGKTVTATDLSLGGIDANNYTVSTTATTTADITALGITGAITAANKTYDGTTAATITDRTLTGVISGDTVSYVGGVATFADKNAGLGKTVTATGLGLAGVDANNYTVNTTATTAADIATLAITGAITASNKTYDGTDAATISGRTLSGVISGDAVSYVGGTAVFADKNAGLSKTVTATGLGLAGTDAGNYTVNDTATTTADIAALGITGAITAVNKVYDGDTTAAITSRTLTGVISGDTVSYVGGTATFADKNAGLAKVVTGVGLTLSGADAGNYTVNTTALTAADITQRSLTVTADMGQTKIYGDADPLPYAYAITSGNLVTGDSLSGALSRDAGENVGTYAITQNTLTAGSNYDLTFLTNAFAITPATLTYLATPVEIFQGVPFPPFTGTVQGFKGSDTLASATTGTPAFTTTAPNSNFPGTFPIDGSGLSANFGNYVFVQDPANATALVIDPAGYPTLPGAPGDAFVGALASAGQSESACAELRDTDGQQTLCGVQLNYRQTERVNLVPGFRRIIDSTKLTFALDGAGIRLPAGVGQ
jgi:filamentous hemagglutinin family protein